LGIGSAVTVTLLKANIIRSSDVAIVTPYEADYHHLRDAMYQIHNSYPELKSLAIWVRKVDGFQGGEAEVVIVSIPSISGPKFLKKAKRANAMLSWVWTAIYVFGNVCYYWVGHIWE
jgi:superfamily I DNA and/or RNA helicase